jgi:cell division protein FtsL
MLGAGRRRSGPRGATFLVAVAILSAVAAALVHVWVRLQVIEAGYQLARETKTRHDLTEQIQKLRLELATRREPSRIERRAREELKMTTPDPSAIRVVHVGRSGPIAQGDRR